MAEFNQKTVGEANEANTREFKAELFLAMFNIFISVELNNFMKDLFITKYLSFCVFNDYICT